MYYNINRSILTLCIAFLLAGTANVLAQSSSVVNLRVQQDLGSLDPAHVGKVTDHAISFLVHSGLVRYDVGSLNIIPDLATDWNISPDGRIYTFHLREGVQWHHDYGELTADDVAYSFNRIKDPATASRFQQDMALVEQVEAVDRYTVRITLSEPFSPFISAVLAFRPGWIVNQRAVEERGDKYGVDPVGTGPYVFDRWTRGTEITLRKNVDYYDAVGIDTVVFKVIDDDTIAELALRTGTVDISYIYEGEPGMRILDIVAESGGLGAISTPSDRTQWVTFNLERPAVQDIRVRQAIIHAINKDAAVEAIYGTMGQAVSSLFSPAIPSYIDPNPFPYDPERARELLAEAGYSDGLSIDVLVMPSRGWPELATIMQDMWRSVGITANLIVRERAIYDELNRGDGFDLLAQNISRADAYQFAAFAYGPNAPFPNTHRYSGADELIEQAAREADPEMANGLWQEFQERILVDDVIGFGMSNVSYVLAWKSGISGVDTLYQDSFDVQRMAFD